MKPPQITPPVKPHHQSVSKALVLLTAAVCLLTATSTTKAQIFVINNGSSILGEYDQTTGTAINASLTSAYGRMALQGNHVWVSGGGDWFNQPITNFTISSGVVTASNTFYINHWDDQGIAVSGSTVYVAYNAQNGTNSVGEYDAQTGTPINDAFITGLTVDHSIKLTLGGNVLYVAELADVRAFDSTTGASLFQISGLTNATGIALNGNTLYVSSSGTGGIGSVGTYDATTGGTLNASFITGLASPQDVAVQGNDLFVTNGSGGSIGEYDATSGATINSSFVSGLNSPSSIVVAPEPSTWAALAGGVGMLLGFKRIRRRFVEHPTSEKSM